MPLHPSESCSHLLLKGRTDDSGFFFTGAPPFRLVHDDPDEPQGLRTVAMFVRSGLARLGSAVARRPLVFIGVSVAVAVVSLLGFLFIPRNVANDFDQGFFSRYSEATTATRLQLEFFEGTGKPWYMGVFGEPRDNRSSMLNGAEMGELKAFYMNLKAMTISEDEKKGNLTYYDFCGSTCALNDALFRLHNLWTMLRAWTDISIRWPVSKVTDYNANIGKHLFHRTEDENGEVTDVKLAALYFMAFNNGSFSDAAFTRLEELTYEAAHKHNSNPNNTVRVTIHSAVGMQGEIKRGISMVIPFAIGGCVLAFVFVAGAFLTSTMMFGRVSKMLAVMVPLALIVPIFAQISAMASCALLGATFNPLFMLVPLFTMATGLDGALHLFHNFLRLQRESLPSEQAGVMSVLFSKFMPAVLINAAPFIALTMGVFIPIEAFAHLCLLVAFSAIFAVLYLMFLFVPLMGFLFPSPTHRLVPGFGESKNTPANKCGGSCETINGIISSILSSSTLVRIASFSIWSILGVTAAIALHTNVHANLEYRHLLPPGSPSAKGASIMSDTVWPDILHVILFVKSPPDLGNDQEYATFRNMVSDFHALPNAMGMNADQAWWYDFKQFVKTPDNATHLEMDKFRKFIEDDVYSSWKAGVKYTWGEDGLPKISRSMLMMAFNGTRTIADKKDRILESRQIAAKYPQYNMVPFDTEVAMVDVLLDIPAVAYYLPPAIFFIHGLVYLILAPNLTCAIISAFAALSSYFGVFGFAVLFNAHLNPFTVGILFLLGCMTTRQAVHMIFHFQISGQHKGIKHGNTHDRMEVTLRNAGLPTFFSLVVGVLPFLPVLFSPIPQFVTLATVVLLQLLFGLVHAFFFVPCLLAGLPDELFGKACCYTRN